MTHLQRLPAGPQLAGRTEEFIGSWLAKHPDNRAKLVLATKVAGPMPVNFVVANREKTLSGNADENAPLPRLVPDQIRKALAASLVRSAFPRYGYCGCCLHALNACAIHSASRSADDVRGSAAAALVRLR